MSMTQRLNAITHTQEYTVLPGVVRHTFIIFGLFTTTNLPPLTQNPGDATDSDVSFPILGYFNLNRAKISWAMGDWGDGPRGPL